MKINNIIYIICSVLLLGSCQESPANKTVDGIGVDMHEKTILDLGLKVDSVHCSYGNDYAAKIYNTQILVATMFSDAKPGNIYAYKHGVKVLDTSIVPKKDSVLFHDLSKTLLVQNYKKLSSLIDDKLVSYEINEIDKGITDIYLFTNSKFYVATILKGDTTVREVK